MEINIIYNEFQKKINIDILKKNGIIQENLLTLCSLLIYNIEYSEIIIDNKSYIIGYDEFQFDETLEKSLEKLEKTPESIGKIIIYDRKRDEYGNVIKKNEIIDRYNSWYADYENEKYINFINSQNGYNRNNSSRNVIQFPIDSLLNTILRFPLHRNYQNNNEDNNVQDNNNNQDDDNNNNDNNEDIEDNQDENHQNSREILNIIDKKIDELNDELNNENEYIDEEDNKDNSEDINDENIEENNEAQPNNNRSMEHFNNIINIFDNYIQNNVNNLENNSNNFFNIINRDMNLNFYNFDQFNNLSNLANEDLEDSEDLDDLPELIDDNQLFNNNNPILYTTFLVNSSFQETHNYEDVKIVLSEENFNNLEYKSFKELNLNESKECLICIDYFNDDDEVLKIECNHLFHKNCIKGWLCEESNKCPICRIEIYKGIQK